MGRYSGMWRSGDVTYNREFGSRSFWEIDARRRVMDGGLGSLVLVIGAHYPILLQQALSPVSLSSRFLIDN
ncbi:hypothetical protein K1719_010822 [Acacia pycnantha]|nr:hypothetical protein K1719_010822 [Acacia pycnantha]